MIVPYRKECRQLQSSMPTTRILSFYSRRIIALQLPQDRVGADRHAEPMHQVFTRRPPILCPINPTISAIRSVPRM
jgi:hypothetical protein